MAISHQVAAYDGKQGRMVAKASAAGNTVETRRANGRPYISPASGILR